MTAWQRMMRAGIHQALVPGIEPPFQPATICREAGLRFAFGMHPQSTAPLDWRIQLERALERHQPAAVGEFGWDRRGGTDFSPVRAQLELAQKQKLPVILHLVGHCPDLLEAVNAYDLTAQLHRCTGRPQRFKSFWESGHYISIGPRLRGDFRLAQAVPSTQILLETDAETEADEPWHRLPQLYQEVAQARNISVEQLIDLVRTNYARFLGGTS